MGNLFETSFNVFATSFGFSWAEITHFIKVGNILNLEICVI